MMVYTNTDLTILSDSAIIKRLGDFVKHTRIQKNKTQVQLAEEAGLNRWTIGQIENGESVSLSGLIQIFRALDVLELLSVFEVNDEISPLEYAKLKKQEKKRVRNKGISTITNHKSEW
jgi:transcriptional regulator with XRE-family HTH domain